MAENGDVIHYLMKPQRCYGGVFYLNGAGPSLKNIERLDMLAVPMIQNMRMTGMQIDLNHFAQLEIKLVQGMEELTEKVRSYTGHYCNLDSGDQVAELLFKKMKLKQARIKMTKSGDRESVEDEVLKAIQHEHPVVSLIQDYKELSKLLGTYVRPMPKLARRVGHGKFRMYPNLGHTRIPSGRLNCVDPNLLAIPNRTDIAKEIPKGFITDEGWVLLSCDESQIEVRVAAHRSQDENLIAVYEDEQDVYYDFATSAFKKKDKRFKDKDGWHYPGIDKDKERFPAKTCVLASIYDVTASGLLEQMPVVCANCSIKSKDHIDKGCNKFIPAWSENNCQDIINAFYMKYSGLIEMRKQDHARAMKYGYIWDDWGRIQHLTAVRSVLPYVVSEILRQGANTPIQATAQGTVKLTMGACFDDWEQSHMQDKCHWLLQVHDELICEVKEDMVEDVAEMIKYRFENSVQLRVPIKASSAYAHTWGDISK